MNTAAPPGALEVRALGLVDYSEALALQRRLASERAAGLICDTLLLLEHPHVLTCGSSFRGHTLKSSFHPVHRVERGGDVTYHGPGQLIGYPIVHLGELGLPVGRYLRLIEGALIATCAAFGVKAERRPGFTGVWAEGKKLASIGVAVKGWVAYHGFALNATTDLSQFEGLYPCGLEPERMGSLLSLSGRAPGMAALRREAARALEDALGARTSLPWKTEN